MPLNVLEACKGCIHDCKISSLNGAELVFCPNKKTVSHRRTTTELSGKYPRDHKKQTQIKEAI